MKKLLLIFPVLTTLLLFVPQFKSLHTAEQPVNKSINLEIYRENNYASAAYDSTIASVHITVCKVAGNKSTPIYEKTFNGMQLKQLPDVQNAMNSSFTIPNLLNSKEKLLIYYDVIYNTRGSELTLSNYMYTSAVKQDDLKINI